MESWVEWTQGKMQAMEVKKPRTMVKPERWRFCRLWLKIADGATQGSTGSSSSYSLILLESGLMHFQLPQVWETGNQVKKTLKCHFVLQIAIL